MMPLAATLAHISTTLNNDPGFVRRGRFINLDFRLGIGGEICYLTIAQGRLAAITPGPALMRPWCFAIQIEADAWTQFCQPVPRPGYHDLFAMCKSGDARIDGDIQPLMANLRYFKELLALARDNELHGLARESGHGC